MEFYPVDNCFSKLPSQTRGKWEDPIWLWHTSLALSHSIYLIHLSLVCLPQEGQAVPSYVREMTISVSLVKVFPIEENLTANIYPCESTHLCKQYFMYPKADVF